MINLGPIIELNRMAREEGQKYLKKRFLFSNIEKNVGKPFIGIVGPRGAGKTVLLRQLANIYENSFYVSLDTIQENLFEVVKKLHQELKIDIFLLDEIHFQPAFEQSLKKIYDFLDVKVIFTSSVALAIFDAAYDLSRRIILKTLYPFSFREYIYFKFNKEIPALSLKDILKKHWDNSVYSYSESFNDYLQGGILPFSLEEPVPLPLLKNIVSTVIRKDIPSLGRIVVNEIETIERLLIFIGKSSVDGINYSSISQNLSITKYKAEQYITYLEKAFILHRILPKGTGVLKEPKILMALPYRLLYSDYEQAKGGLREDFFVEVLKSININFHYLKSTRGAKTPDFLIPFENSELIIEIGGKGKGREQFKGIDAKKSLIFSHSLDNQGIKRPLFLLGLIDRIA